MIRAQVGPDLLRRGRRGAFSSTTSRAALFSPVKARWAPRPIPSEGTFRRLQCVLSHRDQLDVAFDLVMVWKLDRIARSALDALRWLEQLDGYGVGLKILTQDIDTTTSAGRLVFTVLAAVAEMERELISERVKAGVERARTAGRRLGRPPRPAVEELRRWPEIRDLVIAGVITRTEGARRLHVRHGDFLIALKTFRNRGGEE